MLRRAPKIDVDAAGAWLLPWAKQQLARFKKLLRWGKRQFDLPAGEQVTITWGIIDKIKIIAARSANGRIYVSQVGDSFTSVPSRWFLVHGAKIVQYEEASTFPSGLPGGYAGSMSLDGKTLAYIDSNTDLWNVTRLTRGAQVLPGALKIGTSLDVLINRKPLTDQNQQAGVDHVFQRLPVWISEDGKHIYGGTTFVFGANYYTPGMWTLAADQSGPPDPLGSGTTNFSDTTVPLPLRPLQNSGLGFLSGTQNTYPMYDYFSDSPLALVQTRTVSTPGTYIFDDGSGPVTFAFDYYSDYYDLYRFNWSTGAWTQIYTVTYSNILLNQGGHILRLPNSATYRTSDQIGSADLSLSSAQIPVIASGVGTDPWVYTFLGNGVRADPDTSGGIGHYTEGAYTTTSAAYQLQRNGVTIVSSVDNTGLQFPSHAAPNGIIYQDNAASGTLVWFVGGAKVPTGINFNSSLGGSGDFVYLSSAGTELWVRSDSGLGGDSKYHYFENGVDLAQFNFSVPSTGTEEQSTTKALYYVSELVGWSYTNPLRFRMRAYTHTILDFHDTDPPTPFYRWTSASIEDVEVQWNPVTLVFDIVTTYSPSHVLFPSRGPLTEYVPGVTTVSLVDAGLPTDFGANTVVPDGYLPHKV